MTKKKATAKKKDAGSELVLGATVDRFQVKTRELNRFNDASNMIFPGNINPEGYFYSPFYEVKIKELDDDLQYTVVRRINFVPESASVETATTAVYDPEMGITKEETLYQITIISPVPYNLIGGQPFCIYDVMEDMTYRGHLSAMTGTVIKILTKVPIDTEGLTGGTVAGRSRYIISFLEENAPEYAEFIPSTQRLIWRWPKKMSELTSDSSIYDMPFVNGRNYIHQNVNVYVRRQDPENKYKLLVPAPENPLRGYQVDGKGRVDFDYIKNITDSLINAC